MSYKADYRKAVRTAEEVLERFGISQVPLQFSKILQPLRGRVTLMKYTDMVRRYGITMRDIILMLDSELGACAYKADEDRYIIYYNDTKSYQWCRFTIAHELGHIFLDHHKLSGSARLNRTFVSDDVYEEFEKEANAFARNLLSPAPLANLLAKHNPGHEVQVISETFNITEPAATVRLDFLKGDLRTLTHRMIVYFLRFQIVSRQIVCAGCGYPLPRGFMTETARYCPICGGTARKRDYAHKELPEEIQLDAKGSVMMCARCGNTSLGFGARYCRICGAPAINFCEGQEQDNMRTHHLNPSYARYCIECGAPTLFLAHKVIHPEVSMNHYPVLYDDGVPYDEETMRVNICPRCHNKQFGPKAEFCRICGLDLYNRCDGMEEDNWGNWYQNENAMHRNPSNARYCETCGRPTLFFSEKILCDYKDFRSEPLEARIEYPSFSDFETNTDVFDGEEVSAEDMADTGTDGRLPVHAGIDDDDDGELPF